MGHLNFKDLMDGDRNGTVRGMKLDKTRKTFDCEICLRGKMTRTPFPKKSTKSSELLEVIHSDVCGPMRVESNGKARYIVTFIDDYSYWCELRLLKRKDEVFDAFKEFKALVENQTGKTIKFIQSGNGREYRNEKFDTFFKNNDIARRLAVTHTPQKNGVAERRNRTLMDMTRCLLMQSSLPSSFWGEAVNTANYIRNRCPSSSLNGKTPYEKWAGRVPDVSHFREFGCQIYTLNREPTRGKLDSRSKKGIFVGYSNESKRYRVWLPDEKRIDVARDVKFVGTITRKKDYDEVSPDENIYQSQKEIVFPLSTIQNQNGTNKDIERNPENNVRSLDDGQQDPEEESENRVHDPPRRGPGRPRIIRTGLRGRPRKEYSVPSQIREVADTTCLAEIPLERAIGGPHADEWYQAIISEIKSIIKKNMWTVVDRPEDQKVIGSRIVLRNKYKQDGTLDRRKARIIARGFAQQLGINFVETFAPVARLGSVRAMMALAVEAGI